MNHFLIWQEIRQLLWACEGQGITPRFFLRDNDVLYPEAMDAILKSSGIDTIKTPFQAPNANCMIERFVRTIKSESLDRMLIFGERHLEYIVSEFILHYHTERPHQGLDNEIIEPTPPGTGEIVCQERLGGLLKSYRRAA